MVPFLIGFTLLRFLARSVSKTLHNLIFASEDPFAGKVAIVTGSTRGIGRTIAWYLCKAGALVMLNGRNEERMQSTYDQFLHAGFKVATCLADVAIQVDCDRLINDTLEKFGRIDILINNAGIGSRGLFENTHPEVYRKVIHTNVLGSVFPTVIALPYIRKTKGTILFISSLAGFRGLPNRGPYSMSKMMLTSLAESMWKGLKKNGVHVGIMYVGGTKNDPGKEIIQQDGASNLLGEVHSMLMDSQHDVAVAALEAIRYRQYKTIIGVKGALYYFLQKFVPGFVEFILRRSLGTIKKHDK